MLQTCQEGIKRQSWEGNQSQQGNKIQEGKESQKQEGKENHMHPLTMN